MMLTTTSWTVLIATLAGLIIARTPLANIPGPAPIASALLAMLVAVLGSQSNFAGMATAPLFVLVGLLTLLIHIALLALAARAFRFDLQLCGISSLAGIGGVASAPVLAATYTPVLVPIAVLFVHARLRPGYRYRTVHGQRTVGNVPMKQSILIAVAVSSLAACASAPREPQIPAHGVIGVTEAHLDPEFWVRRGAGPRLVLDEAAIAAQNAKLQTARSLRA